MAACETCRFFDEGGVLGARNGLCRRYPQALTVMFGHWCGEFIPAQPPAPAETDSVPPPAQETSVTT